MPYCMSWVGKLSWIFVFAEMEQTKAAQCQTCQSKDWRGTKGQSAPGLAKKTKNVVILGPVQASHFCSVEFNANLLKQWFLLICVEFDATEMRRLNWALTSIMARAFATHKLFFFARKTVLSCLRCWRLRGLLRSLGKSSCTLKQTKTQQAASYSVVWTLTDTEQPTAINAVC